MNNFYNRAVVFCCLICSTSLLVPTVQESGDEEFRPYRYREFMSVVEVVNIFAASDDAATLFKTLELTQDQMVAIGQMEQRYSADIKEIETMEFDEFQFGNHAEQIKAKKAKRGRQLRDDVNEILLPHQLEELGKLDLPQVGPAKLITESLVGDVLELTDKQKERIKERSDKLATEIAKMIQESRQEALDIVNEELNRSQLEKFYELYDRKGVVRSLSSTPVNELYGQYLYTRPEHQDKRYSPLLYIMFSDLKDGNESEKK